MKISDLEEVRHESTERDATFKRILIDTFLEYNMVLDNWRINAKKVGYGDYVSLTKSLLAKHLKHHFNPVCIGRDFKRIDVTYEIMHGRLTKIICYPSLRVYSIVDKFVEYIRTTDFDAFCKELYIMDPYRNSQGPRVEKEITDINDINFNQILNIKF